MSEDVPTFGRENLETEAEKATWDRLAEWHRSITEWFLKPGVTDQFTEPDEPEST